MKLNERIEKINDERELFTKELKLCVGFEEFIFSYRIKELVIKMNVEPTTKKNQRLLGASQEVSSILKEIIKSDSEEEIVNLRKKINSYITLIRKEANTRIQEEKIKEEDLEEFTKGCTEVRNDISRLIRVIKRKNSINEINNIDINELSTEALKEFRKKVNNENNFNNRLNKYLNGTSKTKKVSKQETNSIIVSEENQIENNQEDLATDNQLIMINNLQINNEGMNKLTEKYNRLELKKPREFGNNIIKNLIIFIMNIPTYIINKKPIAEEKAADQTYGSKYSKAAIGRAITENSLKKQFVKALKIKDAA